jgi:soluble epoxide hydrolase/lipid-phosphate phosphatase
MNDCRGCIITSRLVNFYPERVTAVAFLSVGYMPPDPDFEISKSLAAFKQAFGSEIIAYGIFFAEEGSDKIIESNVRPLTSVRRCQKLTRSSGIHFAVSCGLMTRNYGRRIFVQMGLRKPGCWLTSKALYLLISRRKYVTVMSLSLLLNACLRIHQDKRVQTELLLKDGFSAPLKWYQVPVKGLMAEDDKREHSYQPAEN